MTMITKEQARGKLSECGVKGCLICEYAETVIALHERMERLTEALQRHHEWHLAQDRDGDAWGIDPVDAYSESGLCEVTTAAPRRRQGPAREGWRMMGTPNGPIWTAWGNETGKFEEAA